MTLENISAADLARVSYVYDVSPGVECSGVVRWRILVGLCLQLCLDGSHTIAAPPLCAAFWVCEVPSRWAGVRLMRVKEPSVKMA